MNDALDFWPPERGTPLWVVAAWLLGLWLALLVTGIGLFTAVLVAAHAEPAGPFPAGWAVEQAADPPATLTQDEPCASSDGE